MNEERFEELLKSSLKKEMETPLSPNFQLNLNKKVEKRARIQATKAWVIQSLLTVLVGLVGALLLVIFGDMGSKIGAYLPWIFGLAVLFGVFQYLDNQLIRSKTKA